MGSSIRQEHSTTGTFLSDFSGERRSLRSVTCFAKDAIRDVASSSSRFDLETSCVEIVMPSKTMPQKSSSCRQCCRDRSSLCPPCSPCSKCLWLCPGCDILRLVVGRGSFCDSNAREQIGERERSVPSVLKSSFSPRPPLPRSICHQSRSR